MCEFENCWVGTCKEVGEPYCQKHQGMKCVSCGKQATHSCAETGQFVCGAALCGDCEHTTFPDGSNGGIGFNQQACPEGMKDHCKKTEQKYTPWYTRQE